MNSAYATVLIIFLPLVWKLLTGILADEIYDYLEKKMFFAEEQTECRRKRKGTGELLFIGKMIFHEVRMRNKNLAVASTDYKKVYDMVPHPLIVEYLGMVVVSEQIKHFLSESMNESLGRVDIKRGIFQGDSLSHLLFVFCLIPLTVILRKS